MLSSLVDSLYIISHSISFVKWFFELFSSFIRGFSLALAVSSVMPSSLADSSVIISLSLPSCQYLFDKFLRFGRNHNYIIAIYAGKQHFPQRLPCLYPSYTIITVFTGAFPLHPKENNSNFSFSLELCFILLYNIFDFVITGVSYA